MSDFKMLLSVIKEEREKLPDGKRTTGEAIHGLVLEVLGQCIQIAIKKSNDSKDGA